MASITYEHVSKRFGSVTVLDNLHLAIRDQEFLVLVGPSGCGKTTALRCLAGLEQVSAGRLFIGEREVTHLPPQQRDIAMVFQSYALYPHMTVAQNMAFALKMRHAPPQEIARRVQEAAAMLDIAHLLERRPAALSGGQQQRVALGRAMVRDPAVFLMDEPLSNLDARLRVQMRAEISKLHQRLKTTFLYVTHDQTEAMTMGTRIAVLHGGRLQQVDTPQALYERPANRFVAGFIGSPAMNFFEQAQIDCEAGALVVRVPGVLALPVPPPRAAELACHIGRKVLLGIRPEHIHDARFVPPGVARSACFSATVSVTEHMGSEVYVYLARGGGECVGRFDPRTAAAPGQAVEAVVDMERLHLFDCDSEAALL